MCLLSRSPFRTTLRVFKVMGESIRVIVYEVAKLKVLIVSTAESIVPAHILLFSHPPRLNHDTSLADVNIS